VTHVERVHGGATNRVYCVHAARQRAFLRIYRRPDRAMVEREHALLTRLRARGLPVVALIPATSGASYVEHAASFAALYAPAPGSQIDNAELTPSHAHSAGATLARIHRALAELPDAGYVRWTLRWNGPEWVERLNVAERALLAHGIHDETDRWALERLRAQRSWLAQPECVHHHEHDSPAQVTHGDYQNANLFFEGSQVSAVIDWEQAAWMPRGYEVARACAFLFRVEPERTRSFVLGYRSALELDLQQLDDGARGWGAFSDHHVWPLEETYLHGNAAARRYIVHAPFRAFREVWAEARLSLAASSDR
jgi:homoserine kinase type II